MSNKKPGNCGVESKGEDKDRQEKVKVEPKNDSKFGGLESDNESSSSSSSSEEVDPDKIKQLDRISQAKNEEIAK